MKPEIKSEYRGADAEQAGNFKGILEIPAFLLSQMSKFQILPKTKMYFPLIRYS